MKLVLGILIGMCLAGPAWPGQMPATDELQAILEQINLDSLNRSVRELSGLTGVMVDGRLDTIKSRHKLQPGNEMAAQYLLQRFKTLGLQAEELVFSSTGKNILAIQPGTRFPNQVYMICAHYDDMPQNYPLAPGADDNASGSAVVLEAARIMIRRSFPYTILYALWDEEEQGLVGSRFYAQAAAASGDSIQGVVNLDMVAYDSNADYRVTIHARPVAQSMDLAERMVDININYQLGLLASIITPGSSSSDHASFWNSNYSAVMLIEDLYTDFNSNYHSIRDIFDNLNLPYFYRCARLGIGTLASYALLAGPGSTSLLLSEDQRDAMPVRTNLNWQPAERAGTYHVQVSSSRDFSAPVWDRSAVPGLYDMPLHLQRTSGYYAHVRGQNRAGSGSWSETVYFHTADAQHQFLALQKGWNLVASALLPEDSSLTVLLGGLGTHLGLLRNAAGEVFQADRSQGSAEFWRAAQGFWMYMNAPDTLAIQGDPINTVAMQIPLRPGWNLTAYVRRTSMAIDSALSPIRPNVLLAKNSAGQVFWPEYGIDDIDYLQPGDGYQVYLTAQDTLAYPAEPLLVAPPSIVRTRPFLTHFPFEQHGPTGLLLVHSTDFQDGDELAVRSERQRLIGSGLVRQGRALLAIMGDDSLTTEVEGARDGEILQVYHWSRQDDQELAIILDSVQEKISGLFGSGNVLRYRTDAVWIAEGRIDYASPTVHHLAQNFPNPFNMRTSIEYALPQAGLVRLEIFNVAGQRVEVLVDQWQEAGRYVRTLSRSDLASGMYLARLRAGSYEAFRKMLLVR